jgi:hypothetical protein
MFGNNQQQQQQQQQQQGLSSQQLITSLIQQLTQEFCHSPVRHYFIQENQLIAKCQCRHSNPKLLIIIILIFILT